MFLCRLHTWELVNQKSYWLRLMDKKTIFKFSEYFPRQSKDSLAMGKADQDGFQQARFLYQAW